jgi:predicted RecB family nuclease
MTISKSKYCAGVQCLKRLYLLVHSPELAAQPDAAAEAIIQQGHEVGMLARTLFPGGVEVCSEHGLGQAIKATRELVANPDVQGIFEGVFEHQNVLVKVDILHRRRDGRWRLIEVKSTSDVKDHHLEDVAIQYRVVSRSGVDVASACLAHVNRSYVYPGGEIDPRRFFRIRNLTRRVQRLQPKLTFQLRSEFTVLGMPKAPDIAPGKQCTSPVTCEFFDRCNPPRPDDHVGYLPRIHASAMEELEEMGVESIRDIPDDFDLTDIQRRAATCVQTGEPWFDRDGLALKMATLRYPIAYLDFETINPAIPRFAETHPYQQIPFQWSAHIQQRPGSEPQHYEFLATDENDPRREFTSSLVATLGETGSIAVYSSFECQRLSDLASWFPEFADRINAIQARLFDLLPVVREHTYHPAYAGSYSIKSVLPALVPEMTYDGMEVANGQDAGLAWESLVRGDLNSDERERIEKALRAYCGQDTLALVALLERLQNDAAVRHYLLR